jgi:uncharacterized protein
MAARRPDPRKLDVAALAADAAQLAGDTDAGSIERWRDMQTPPADVALPPVHWVARGEQRQRSGELPQTWLHLQVSAEAWLTCQRCLQPFRAPLGVQRTFRLVATEAEAEALDADSEDDVLAPSPAFDLIGLIEDELVLAWPLVPRHERCSQPVHRAGDAAADVDSPFAALAALKARTPRP